MQRREQQLTLRDYVAPLLSRRWLIIAIVIVLTAATYVYASRHRGVYVASTKLYTAQESNPLVGVGAGFSDDRTVQNQAILATSNDVAALVARNISYRGSPSALAGSVSATPATGADFITITAHAGSGSEAARIANAFAQAFISVRTANGRAAVDKALAQLRQQLRSIPNTPVHSADRSSIANQIRQLQVAASTGTGNATQLDAATAPSSPSGLRPWVKALIAAAVALFGSGLLAYLLERLDPRLKSIEEAASIYQRTNMANVFHDKDIEGFTDDLPSLSERSRETFRQLRINLAVALLDKPDNLILITSAGPGEGKSTVARNLALALQESGRRVALVDADLRKSALSAMLGVPSGMGLTSVLSGEAGLVEVLVSVHVASPAGQAEQTGNGGENDASSSGSIAFLPAGPPTPNPPAMLESPQTASVLDELAARNDVVIIDTAPLAPVGDTVPLLARADAILVVTRSGVTDQRSARRAADVIGRVPGANLVGVVVNDLSETAAAAYGGRYGYGYTQRSRKRRRGRRREDASATEAART
jgi:Mrp family chromosome partitioning ATPase/capsular polysaccharide biosynthesis protein